jgi:hypothetical protein
MGDHMKDPLKDALEEAGERPDGLTDDEWLLLAFERVIQMILGALEPTGRRQPNFAYGFVRAEILDRMKTK